MYNIVFCLYIKYSNIPVRTSCRLEFVQHIVATALRVSGFANCMRDCQPLNTLCDITVINNQHPG